MGTLPCDAVLSFSTRMARSASICIESDLPSSTIAGISDSSEKTKLTAKTQRMQRHVIVFYHEFLCALCVFAVKRVFMANSLPGNS
jgi:hypothetical protein